MKFAFFGSSQFSIHVLNELKKQGIVPSLIITTPDKPRGRKLILTPNPVKIWGRSEGLEVLDPKSLKKDAEGVATRLKVEKADIFLVASYGKIIPPEIFNIPTYKTLNIHPSLLPKYRGASPIMSQILDDSGNQDGGEGVGVSLMQIDEGMDTGPVIIKEKVKIKDWPIGRLELEEILAKKGAELFARHSQNWIEGRIEACSQDDSKASYCQIVSKEAGLLDPTTLPHRMLLQIKAYQGWPTTYFFLNRNGRDIRVIITDAVIGEDGKVKILRVVPEGKKEMFYEDFLRGNK